MRRLSKNLGTATLFFSLFLAPAPAAPPRRPALVLLAPGLRLADLHDPRLPNLAALGREGAVALINGLTPTGQAELRSMLGALPGETVTTATGRYLRHAPERPYGLAADISALSMAAVAGLERNGLVRVEPGDMERAQQYAPLCFPGPAARHRTAALADLDRLIGRLRPAVHARDGELHLLVPVPATPGPHGMGLWIVTGLGWHPGRLASAATRGKGVVARADVIVGLRGSTSRELRVVPGGLVDLERLATASERAERLRRPAWAVLRGGVLLLAALALLASRRPRLARSLLPATLVLFLALLLAGDLVAPPGEARAVWHLGLVVAAVAAARARRELELPLLAATTLLLLGEIGSGGPLLMWSPLGYSIALGARSYGIGNEAMGVLLGAALLLPFTAADASPGRMSRLTVAVGGTGLWLLVALLAGSPAWGANLGGALATVLTASLAAPILAGRPLRVRHVLIGLAALVILALALALWDASRPTDAQSHLGRLMATIRTQGLAPLAAIAASKAATAVRVTASLWGLLLVAEAVVGMVMLRRRPWSPGELSLQAGVPLLLPAAAALLLFNDSGVVAAALCLAILPAAACGAWRTEDARRPSC